MFDSFFPSSLVSTLLKFLHSFFPLSHLPTTITNLQSYYCFAMLKRPLISSHSSFPMVIKYFGAIKVIVPTLKCSEQTLSKYILFSLSEKQTKVIFKKCSSDCCENSRVSSNCAISSGQQFNLQNGLSSSKIFQ